MGYLCFNFCFGRCYCQWFLGNLMLLADVIAMLPFWVCNLCFVFGWCYSQLLVFFMADGDVVAIWLMFVLADVIAICFCGCWYYHFDHQLYQKVCHCCCCCCYFLMADVIARMADGIAMYMIGRCYCHVADVFTTVLFLFWWQMLLPLLCSFVLLADVVVWWLMECSPWVWMADVIAKVADGIATGSMF